MPAPSSSRSLSLLRALVREAALTARDAPEGLALAVLDDGSEKSYVLYDSQAILDAVEVWRVQVLPEAEELTARYAATVEAQGDRKDPRLKPKFLQDYTDGKVMELVTARARATWVGGEGVRGKVGTPGFPVLGMISVAPNDSDSPQWGAATVKLAAAEPGWGPFLYDIVMHAEGGIVSDRDSVSSAARGVWRHYRDSRPDVEAKPLDNAREPRTRVKRDDVEGWFPDKSVKGEPPTNPLNYAYFSGKRPPMGSLRANHRKAKAVLDQYRIPLYSMADLYFSVRYRGR